MIDINHVSFQYSGAEQENLQELVLHIKKGECVVLTGESGCGKTCVTRLINTLIPHFYEGEMSGTVSIDGVDTRTIQPHDLSDKIGSVFQNPRSQFFSLDTDSEIVFGMENKGIIERGYLYERTSKNCRRVRQNEGKRLYYTGHFYGFILCRSNGVHLCLRSYRGDFCFWERHCSNSGRYYLYADAS